MRPVLKWHDRQPSLWTTPAQRTYFACRQMWNLLILQHRFGSEGKDCSLLLTSSQKVNPSKRAHFLPHRTTGGSIHKKKKKKKVRLNECFIQVKATINLPLSTYDTILPLKHYHPPSESRFHTETTDLALII